MISAYLTLRSFFPKYITFFIIVLAEPEWALKRAYIYDMPFIGKIVKKYSNIELHDDWIYINDDVAAFKKTKHLNTLMIPEYDSIKIFEYCYNELTKKELEYIHNNSDPNGKIYQYLHNKDPKKYNKFLALIHDSSDTTPELPEYSFNVPKTVFNKMANRKMRKKWR